jgi:putative membrane protein
MKRILRHYIINTFSLYLISQVFGGLFFEKGPESILLAGLGLTASSLLIRPIINLLLLPINLITFNLFKWVSNALALYIVTLIVPGFKITTFVFSGLATKWLDIPKITLSGIFAYVAFSVVLSLMTSIVHWIIK